MFVAGQVGLKCLATKSARYNKFSVHTVVIGHTVIYKYLSSYTIHETIVLMATSSFCFGKKRNLSNFSEIKYKLHLLPLALSFHPSTFIPCIPMKKYSWITNESINYSQRNKSYLSCIGHKPVFQPKCKEVQRWFWQTQDTCRPAREVKDLIDGPSPVLSTKMPKNMTQ